MFNNNSIFVSNFSHESHRAVDSETADLNLEFSSNSNEVRHSQINLKPSIETDR